MSNGLDISVSQMEGRVPVSVLHITGQVDASNAGDLETRASEVIEAGAKDVLLDLAKVDYMASAGFRALHVIYNSLHGGVPQVGEAKAPHLQILGASDDVRKIFKTLGFDAYLNIHDDLREAVDSF